MRFPEVPFTTPEEHQASTTTREKATRFSPSSRNEAYFQTSVSRVIPRSHLKHKMVLDPLSAIPGFRQDTHPHTRETPSFPSQLKESHVCPLVNSRQGLIPLLRPGKESQGSHGNSEEEAGLTLKLEHIPGSGASV